MEHLDTILHFGGPTLGISLVSVGLGMIRMDEFAIARVLFWIAVLFFAMPAFQWQFSTTEPWEFRVISGAVAGTVVYVIFPMLLEWSRKRERMAAERL
jgi:hypothetical protein